MSSLKRVTIVFLIIAILGLAVSNFASWYMSEDDQTVEVAHGLWRTDVTVNDATNGTSWFDSSMDGSKGIDQIRMAGPLVAGGAFMAIISFIFIAARMDHHHRIVGGGILGILGVGALIGGALVYMQGIDAMDLNSDNYRWSGGMFTTFGAAGFLFLGSVLSFGYIREPIQKVIDLPFIPEEEPEPEPYEPEVRKITEHEERLRCPACKHMFIHPKGVPHECPECGYEA